MQVCAVWITKISENSGGKQEYVSKCAGLTSESVLA